MLVYFLFVVGFVFLIKGADFLVSGSSSIAKKLKVSDIVIGLTIVAFGTSMPELIVNLLASVSGKADLAIGNILGSNIANILLILGASAIIYPLTAKSNTIWKEIPFAILAVLALICLASDKILSNSDTSVLSRGDGLTLILFFAIFLVYTLLLTKKVNPNETDEFNDTHIDPLSFSIFQVVVGLIGLVIGGQWIVDGATTIASNLGLSQSLIGLTVVAVGTSLPELATSVMAAKKKKADIAIGNVVGSNIFNILWILGLTSVAAPIPFQDSSNLDLWVTLFVTILLFAVFFIGKKHLLEKWQGYLFVALYFLYTAYLVLNDLGVM